MESPFEVLSQVARLLEQQGVTIPKADDFAKRQLKRRQPRRIAPDIDQFIYVATAEDTILAKLRWYREGDEVSSTQWSDVLGVLGAQSVNLDKDYLREWAAKLGVRDLLEKAFSFVEGKLLTKGTHKSLLPSPGQH